MQTPIITSGDVAIYAPSPAFVIDAALTLARLQPGERFVDLGAGDGRVVLAATACGANAIGVEHDIDRVATAQAAGANVICGDLFTFDLSLADVVYCYLMHTPMQRVAWERMRPGSRLVSLDFKVMALTPARVVTLKSDKNGGERIWNLYLYEATTAEATA